MSWSAFDELKVSEIQAIQTTFAAKIKDQCKRKKDWSKPSSKKHKVSDKGSAEEEGGIDGFSSEEEEENVSQKPIHAGKQKIVQKHLKRSPRKHDKTSSAGSDGLDELMHDLDVLIEDLDDTPESDQNQPKAACSSSATKTEDQIQFDASEDEKESEIPVLQDVAIKDFHSSDEEEKEQKPEEPDIDTPTPTPTPSSIPTPTPTVTTGPEVLPTTGSEWLKKIQSNTCKSNDKGPSSPDVKAELDSAKKTKQKFKRSGLAEQLQRLINREKSEKTFWSHRMTSGKKEMNDTNQGTSSTLDVQVLSIYTQYSLHITRCCVLSGNHDNNKPMVVDVLFNAEATKQLPLMVGCAIRIHPPWQKLHPSSSPYPILLCTYYCEKLPTPPGSPIADVASLSDVAMMPHQSDQAGPSRIVQSPQKGFKPTKLLFGENKEETENPSPGVRYRSRESNKPCKLLSITQAMEAQGGCSGGSVSFQAVIQRIYRRRVKIPRDKAIDGPGHINLSKSLITRARNGEDKEEARWIILVQDSSFNLCEIQIPQEYSLNDEWVSCIRNGEGKVFVFNDLMVTQRTNKTRSPGLFDLMDSLWCTESSPRYHGDKSSQILSSQDTTSQSSRPLTSPPNYCYILTVQDESHVIHCDEGEQHVSNLCSLFKSPSLTNLRDMFLYDGDAPKRVAVWCRLICSRPSPSTKTSSSDSGCPSWTGQLLVTDASLQLRAPQESRDSEVAKESLQYLKIDVRLSHVMSESVRVAVSDAGNVLYFQDIACSRQGAHGLYADSYTTIKKGAIDPCQSDIDTGDIQVMSMSIYTDLVVLRARESINLLSSTSKKESLCKVEGVIQGVDEDSACCWLECAVCGSQDLLERSGLPYFCQVCQHDVSEPLTKTNLDVIVTCDSWKEARVKVKLLQATIEQLLPVSYQESDQGYDIERVLGKRLGPLYCYVEQLCGLTANLEEIVISL